MTLRSPTSAMLWELWQLTHAEIAWKLMLPLGVALAALGLDAAFEPAVKPTNFPPSDTVAAFALVIIVLPHLAGWRSIGKLNGGAPGFPFSLGYTRPVRTSVLVGLPLAYLTVAQTVIYVVSAMVLRAVTGYAFPLLPAAAWLAGLKWVGTAGGWSTRDRTVQVFVPMVALAVAFLTVQERLTGVEIEDNFDWPPRLWPTLFDWPRTDYAWLTLIGLVCFGITVFMVTRQRRGDQLVGFTWTPDWGLRDQFVSGFRLPCPTSSATRAQAWLDLKSNGLPVLTIGAACAMAVLLVSAASGPIDAALNANPPAPCPIEECFYVRAMPPLIMTPFSLLTVFVLGRNAFGIRRKQGRTYVSAFEATQAYGTAPLAILKLLVHSACVLAAVIAIAASFWISIPLLGDKVFVQVWGVPLSSRRALVIDAFAALTGYRQLALVVVATVSVVIAVAGFAVFGALRTRYSRRATITSILLVLYGLVFVWLAVGVRVDPATASRLHLDVVYGAMGWLATAAMVFTTIYVFWSGIAEHALSIRYASGAVAIAAAFGAAWLTALHITGEQLAGMSAMNAFWAMSPAFLLLMASGLVPWSYGRIRSL